MTDWKWFTVYWLTGLRTMACTTVVVDVLATEAIRPWMARKAALAAVGVDCHVWVFSTDETGYALYPASHRELSRRDLERYTIMVYEEAGSD